ncbi:MAG: M3 family metallopeptidase [Helicobacteraceae bacterium]|nr:M3 family metallopeptidase [Helicobacteraceae bacterium]
MFAPFEIGTLEDKPSELSNLLQKNEAAIDALCATQKPTYKRFVRALDTLAENLACFFTPVSIMQYTKNSDKTQSAYNAMLPMISAYDTKLNQDERIYAIYQAILERDESLNATQRKILRDSILDFELEGAGKSEAIKARIKAINVEISDLGNRFSQNLLDDTKAFEKIIDSAEDVKGIPQSDLESFAIEGGKWRFTLLPHSFYTVMTHCQNRAAREELYKARATRASQNEAIIERLLALKDEKAKLLGFDNFAEYSIKTKMASNAKEAEDFVRELIQKSRKQAEKELEELQEFAEKNGFNDKLQSYDTAFWSKRLEEYRFNLDDELYKPYFETQNVMGGLLDFLAKLFDISFTAVDTPVWDDSVIVYDLQSEGKTFARLYADLYERAEKRGGAWMDGWQSRMRDESDRSRMPSAYIACNFPAPSEASPSLLRHNDVVTLFHEMGHAIHHLFAAVDERGASGINGVEWDAVEFPSQWLENFAYEPTVLTMFAKHYKTGKKLPKKMIQKLIDAKNFMSATAMLRQNEFALFDLSIYKKPYSANEVQQILDDIRQITSLIKPPPYNKFQNGFSHIFGGGYAAGYYSYKWAEVLSADAFLHFIERGIFDPKTAKSFMREVLSAGSSRSAMENFEAFMGRKPNSAALLKLSGIEE